MIVLAIDTAGVDCSAAVYDGDAHRLLGEATEMIGRGHAEKLMATIDAALDAAKIDLSAVERIAVTIGPGSFTGIRVGRRAWPGAVARHRGCRHIDAFHSGAHGAKPRGARPGGDGCQAR